MLAANLTMNALLNKYKSKESAKIQGLSCVSTYEMYFKYVKVFDTSTGYHVCLLSHITFSFC